jgi:hypothetical protein
MTKIKRLNEVEDPREFIKSLQDRNLLIYEDVQGSKLYVKWTGDEFIIKPKSLRNEPLNFLDLTLQKFYTQAHAYFLKLPLYVTDLINPNWWFLFEYFPDNQPANIEYQKTPKNNLILTSIIKKGVYTYHYEELFEYANLLDVDLLPVIYKGTLSTKQLEIIELYLRTSEKDLDYVFGDKNFASFFYHLLNPVHKNSYLMEEDNFNENIEKLVIKIDELEDFSFEILNPLYSRLAKINHTDYTEVYSLILVNFLEFIQMINLNNLKSKYLTQNEMYIDLISQIFNQYMENISKDILVWDFDIPEFFKEDKFKINIDLLENEKTVNWIKKDPKIEYVFKCILGSFAKPKKKSIGVFTKQTLTLFNNWIENLQSMIERKLKINRDYAFQRSDVKNFKEFWDLKYNTDAAGDIYPDIYGQFMPEEDEDKKKKKKKEVLTKKPFKKPEDDWDEPFELDKEKL